MRLWQLQIVVAALAGTALVGIAVVTAGRRIVPAACDKATTDRLNRSVCADLRAM